MEEGNKIGTPIAIDAAENAVEQVVIAGVPLDWFVSAGQNDALPVPAGDGLGEVDVTGWDLSQFAISPPFGAQGDYTLSVVTTVISPNGEPGVSETAMTVSVVPNDGIDPADLDLSLIAPIETDPTEGLGEIADALPDDPDATEVEILDPVVPPEPVFAGLGF